MKTRHIRRIIFMVTTGFIAIVIGLILLSDNFPLGKNPDDFIAYWSAGRLLSLGKDPYSPENTLGLTKELGFGDSGSYLTYFYPPWTLPIFLPFGLLSYSLSRSLWFLVSVLVFTSSAIWIWNIYHGPGDKKWILILGIFLISPVIISLLEGQVTPLILLGIVGFIYFEKKQRWLVAGSFLALTTFKIHVLYLFWIALFLWLIFSKNWAILVGLVGTLGMLTLILLLAHPNAFTEFLRISSENLPTYCANPSLSSLLCIIFNERRTWHILLGPALGITWLTVYWVRNKDQWNWMNILPMLIFISLITVPYTWIHDGLLYTIAVLQIIILFLNQGFTRPAYLLTLLFIITNMIVYLQANNLRNNPIVFIWLPLVYLLLFMISKTIYSGKSTSIRSNNQTIIK